MSKYLMIVFSTLVAVTGNVASAADFDAASYHQAQCTRCHDSSVYTRKDRRVNSYQALQSQVARCDANLATKLFPEDLAQLVDYLNNSYYKFQK